MKRHVTVGTALCIACIALPGCEKHRLAEADYRWGASKRCLTAGFMVYRVDHERWPPTLAALSTPVCYISPDPEVREQWLCDLYTDGQQLRYFVDDAGTIFILASVGPDGTMDESVYGEAMLDDPAALVDACYDPTNGIASAGDRFHLVGAVDQETTERLQKLHDVWPSGAGIAWDLVTSPGE